jgi:hypothetical protein
MKSTIGDRAANGKQQQCETNYATRKAGRFSCQAFRHRILSEFI